MHYGLTHMKGDDDKIHPLVHLTSQVSTDAFISPRINSKHGEGGFSDGSAQICSKSPLSAPPEQLFMTLVHPEVRLIMHFSTNLLCG